MERLLPKSDAIVTQDKAKEQIGRGTIEVRYADLEQDATRIAELFRQPSAREHLAGISPTWRTEELDVKRFAEKHPRYHIVLADRDGIMKLYEDYDGSEDSSTVLLVAEDKKSGQIVGTRTIIKPTGPGMTYAMGSRLVVDKKCRRQGVATMLLEASHALTFLPKDMGGFDLPGIEVGYIVSKEGEEEIEGNSHLLAMFKKAGFPSKGQRQENYCVSWNNRLRRFDLRDSIRLQMSAQKYWERHDKEDMQKILPVSKEELLLF